MPCTPKHKSKPRLAPPVVPRSRFGAMQEKGNPEKLDLIRSTIFFAGESCPCKQCDTRMRYQTHTLKDYKVMSDRRGQVLIQVRVERDRSQRSAGRCCQKNSDLGELGGCN